MLCCAYAAAHAVPADQRMIFVLLSDGTLLLCGVAGGTMTPVHSVTVPLGSGGEGGVRAFPHPLAFGGALVVVEGTSTLTLIELGPR